MATTRTVLRQKVGEAQGDYWSSTASGNGTTTTLVDTVLAQVVTNDDELAQTWIYFTSGTAGNIGKERRTKLTGGYTASSTTLTWNAALGSATASADGYELHRLASPTMKNNAINRAAEYLAQTLYLPLNDETLVVDDLGTNSDFETYSSGFTGWTSYGAGVTITQETTIIRHGLNAAKVVAGGGAAGGLYQAITPNLNAISGKTAFFHCWVNASAASTARIAISLDGGTTFTYSSYHTGPALGSWELLKVSVALTTAATSLRIYLVVAAGGTAYFDAGRTWIDSLYRYTLPTSFSPENIPYGIEQQADELDDSPTALYYPVTRSNPPISGRRLRVYGKGTLSTVSAESDTMEVSKEFVNPVVQGALSYINRALASDPGGSGRDLKLQEYSLWKADMKELMEMFGNLSVNMAAQDHRGVWDVKPSGETGYIYFHSRPNFWWGP